MPSPNFAFYQEDISADTGILYISPVDSPVPAVDDVVQMTRFRVRIETHTDDPAGQFLVTIEWSDGKVTQSFNASFFNSVAGDYLDSAMQEAWHDRSGDMTIRVRPTVAGGSVNVKVLYDGN